MARQAPERNNVSYVKLKRTKQNEVPEFIFKDKVGADYEETKGTFISGVISKIETVNYEWPENSGKMVHGYKMHMQDKDEKYILGLSYTWMSRGILNALANIETPGMISIEVLPSKKDGDGYPSAFVNNDEDNCKWLWPFKELQDMVSYATDSADFSKLNEFLDKQIIENIGPKFEEAFKRMSVDGNFPAAAYRSGERTEPDPLLDEVTEKMEESGELEQKTEHEGSTAYIGEAPKALETPPVQEQEDDLPF